MSPWQVIASPWGNLKGGNSAAKNVMSKALNPGGLLPALTLRITELMNHTS